MRRTRRSFGGWAAVALVAGAVEEPPRADPPSAPAIGACYIVAEDATGVWEGKAGTVAVWTSGGWRLIGPCDGMTLYERTSGTWATFRGGAWEIGNVRGSSLFLGDRQVVGPQAPAIEPPAGGSVVDAEARTAIEAILDRLRQHGLIAE